MKTEAKNFGAFFIFHCKHCGLVPVKLVHKFEHYLDTQAIAQMAVHWNGNVVILIKFSSQAELKVVKMTASSAASDENFVKITTFLFLCGAILEDYGHEFP